MKSTFAHVAPFLLCAAGILPAQTGAPRLLSTAADLARLRELADSRAWAGAVRDSIISTARSWPAAFEKKYWLDRWSTPPEGGQWSMWYVCPRHGVSLNHLGPDIHECPIDKQRYQGWPYDQVIYARQHNDLATYARDLALAYQFTGDETLAASAVEILLAYADRYVTYPLHDKDDRNTASGGRVLSQTLDESIWLISIAWAYDLLVPSQAMSAQARAHIEQDLLREAAEVIRRNNAGKGNWQSWHNAALGAVGFALQDQDLIREALDGRSGFRYQMKESVSADGAWFEGSWGYHFYALQAHCYLAEMAARSGIDLYSDPALRKMFDAPLLSALPDGTLPAFNDSRASNLSNYDTLYELAWQRYGDPIYGIPLGKRTRGREAFFWGAETIPPRAGSSLPSTLLPATGQAILRNEVTDHAIAFKFGPHGGWHGHYDKLTFVSYALGGELALDPGTQSYAAPTHATWDKVTVSHNTVVVDEQQQREATGELRAFAALPGVSLAAASAGPANPGVELQRSLLLAPEYAVDIFDAFAIQGEERRFDWVYHNAGKLSSSLPLETYNAFPRSNGYQHLSRTMAADTAEPWQATFEVNITPGAAGSIWASAAAVRGTYTYSREQAAAGNYSAKLGYEFGGSGYLLYNRQLASPPGALPQELTLMVYGDGSGHRLAIRLNDVTDERFAFSLGPVDWRGWRLVRTAALSEWRHFQGNNDGVFDLPAKSVSFELAFATGGPSSGALFIDDIVMHFADQSSWEAAGFEIPQRSLRVWMLGAGGTTVVQGEGLGQDLRQPVPFVMARRRAASTRFETLLEPFAIAPRVKSFRAAAPDAWQVDAQEFQDWFSLAGGALRYMRRAGDHLVRLAMSGTTSLRREETEWLRVEQPIALQVDFADNGAEIQLRSTDPYSGSVRVLAPQAARALWNGLPAELERDGDFAVVRRKALP